ncbi:MAG: hypothetical protein IJ762_09520 [Bacteroidaceae bacterium]|nr:hypothetical protein [Bacteroidaceae bacterium]
MRRFLCTLICVAIWGAQAKAEAKGPVPQGGNIDNALSEECRTLLQEAIMEHGLDSVEIAVFENQTGHIRAWLAVKREGNTCTEGELWKERCSQALMRPIVAISALEKGGLSLTDSVDTGTGVDSIDGMCIYDHNWRRGGYGKITYQEGIDQMSNIAMYRAIRQGMGVEAAKHLWNMMGRTVPAETNPGMIAVMFGALATDGVAKIPDMETGEVTTERNNEFSPSALAMIKQGLTYDMKRPNVMRWLDPDMHWMATTATTPMGEKCYEIAFCGCFPVESPEYTLCVVANKKGLPVGSKQLGYIVNPLAKYLTQKD